MAGFSPFWRWFRHAPSTLGPPDPGGGTLRLYWRFRNDRADVAGSGSGSVSITGAPSGRRDLQSAFAVLPLRVRHGGSDQVRVLCVGSHAVRRDVRPVSYTHLTL